MPILSNHSKKPYLQEISMKHLRKKSSGCGDRYLLIIN